MSPMGSENSGNPDHDTLLYIKTLQEVLIKNLDQAQVQLNKDIYGLTVTVKELRTEHREDVCKMDKRIGAMEKLTAVYESCFEQIKENNIVKKTDLKETAKDIAKQFADLEELMMKEDEETREEGRRREATLATVAGLVGAVGGSFITIIAMLWIG